MAWLDDEEFGRQMLAGTNPTRIQCLEVPNPLPLWARFKQLSAKVHIFKIYQHFIYVENKSTTVPQSKNFLLDSQFSTTTIITSD